MSPSWTVSALLTGILLSPGLRGLIFLHSVPVGQTWRTSCQGCDRPIRLIGWKARCSGCRIRLGPPPASVEVVAASALALIAWQIHGVLPLLALAWITLIGVVLAFVDVAVHRLPDRLTYSAFAGAAVLLAVADPTRLGYALLGAAALAGGYLLLALANPAGMGLGDVKLALSLGLAFGWFGWLMTVYGAAAGFVLSGLFAVIMLATRRLTRHDAIPHGPFMLLGALTAVLLLAP